MDGVTVKVLRGEFIVPGVTLRLHFKHEAALDALQPGWNANPKESNRLLFAFALDILKQNYPDLTEDALLDQCGLADVGGIIGAALPQSGYSRRPLDREKPIGSPDPSSSAGSSTPPAGDPATSST